MKKPASIELGLRRLERNLPDLLKWLHYAASRDGLCSRTHSVTWRTQYLQLLVDYLREALQTAEQTLEMSQADDKAKGAK